MQLTLARKIQMLSLLAAAFCFALLPVVHGPLGAPRPLTKHQDKSEEVVTTR